MRELTIKNIEEVIEEKVRPALAAHNGDLVIEDLTDGVLTVKFVGACQGCPSAEITLNEVVTEELMAEIPDLKEVKMVQGVSDELIDFAKEFLKKRHSK